VYFNAKAMFCLSIVNYFDFLKRILDLLLTPNGVDATRGQVEAS
jgi:hypothetical protein